MLELDIKYEDHIKMSSVGKASERLYCILVTNNSI
jgi:hypothetical protein